MKNKTRSIGVFDSGVGGLTVLKQLKKQLPNQRFIYLGDTARVPYGNRSPETIIRFSTENALFLLEKEIKLLIIACSTVSAIAIDTLRSYSPIPIIGVIEPGIQKTLKTSSSKRIAILATRATIQSGVYQDAIKKEAPHAVLFPVACPLFVPLVEEGWLSQEGWLSHPATRLIVKEYLKPLKHENVDTILLGCTHYPVLKNLIKEEIGGEVILVDSASACAEQVATYLNANDKLSPSPSSEAHQYFISDSPEMFRLFAEQLFEHKIEAETVMINSAL